jgi:hypothetical protein
MRIAMDQTIRDGQQAQPAFSGASRSEIGETNGTRTPANAHREPPQKGDEIARTERHRAASRFGWRT